MKRLWMILACLLLFCAGTQAGTVYDSTGQVSVGSDPVQSFGPLYDSFSTGTVSGVLSGLQFILSGSVSSVGEDFPALDGLGPYTSVGLYADNSTSPGALIATLGTIYDSSLSGSGGLIDLSLVTNPVLAAGTRYWIGLVGFGTSANWYWTDDTSGIGVNGEFFGNASGVFPNNPDGGYQMQVTVGAVPEPSSLALSAGAFAALALLIRRRVRK
jgi:hypothetical protein